MRVTSLVGASGLDGKPYVAGSLWTWVRTPARPVRTSGRGRDAKSLVQSLAGEESKSRGVG